MYIAMLRGYSVELNLLKWDVTRV